MAGLGQPISLLLKITVGVVALGFLLGLLSILLSYFGAPGFITDILPIAAMLLFVLGGFVFFILTLACLFEILFVSKNDGGWKVLWTLLIILTFFFFPLGLVAIGAYLSFGRKTLKE